MLGTGLPVSMYTTKTPIEPEVICLTFQTSSHEKDEKHGRNWHDSKQAY
jgi:hypothetical protein